MFAHLLELFARTYTGHNGERQAAGQQRAHQPQSLQRHLQIQKRSVIVPHSAKLNATFLHSSLHFPNPLFLFPNENSGAEFDDGLPGPGRAGDAQEDLHRHR